MSRFWDWFRSADRETQQEIEPHIRAEGDRLPSQEVGSVNEIEPPLDTPRAESIPQSAERFPWQDVPSHDEPDHASPEQEN